MKDDIWIVLRVFYQDGPVEMEKLTKKELEVVEKFSSIGKVRHYVSFRKKRAYVGLTKSGREYLSAFISGASYCRE
jgi:hypothetical protein